MLRLGFHTSIAGSVVNAANEAIENRYTAFQMFTASSRSWKGAPLEQDEIADFRKTVEESDLAVNAHIPYLCNPCSTNPEMHKKSITMLIENMKNCNALGIEYLVIHVGSHLGKGLQRGINNAIEAITKGLHEVDGVSLLLENTAGYNNSVGSRFEEIGRIIDSCGSKRLGLCLDTCHAFAAGYDISTPASIDKLVSEIDGSIGIRKMRLVHLNDSKYELGSGLDRHWHIGQGYIGRKGFLSMFGNRNFREGTFIMETPVNPEGDEKGNYAAAKGIIAAALRSKR